MCSINRGRKNENFLNWANCSAPYVKVRLACRQVLLVFNYSFRGSNANGFFFSQRLFRTDTFPSQIKKLISRLITFYYKGNLNLALSCRKQKAVYGLATFLCIYLSRNRNKSFLRSFLAILPSNLQSHDFYHLFHC